MIDSISICRKLYGCGNGMQYTGAVLILMNKNVEKTVANRGSNRLWDRDTKNDQGDIINNDRKP